MTEQTQLMPPGWSLVIVARIVRALQLTVLVELLFCMIAVVNMYCSISPCPHECRARRESNGSLHDARQLWCSAVCLIVLEGRHAASK